MKMAESLNTLPAKRYIFCNNCKRETNHVCEAERRRFYYDEETHLSEQLGWRFWVCAGCEHSTLEEFYTCDGMEDEKGKKLYDIKYFPERATFHVERKNFNRLPRKLNAIYREILHAFNSKLVVLCAIGIRALLEGICADKGIGGGNMEDRINGMASILPQNIVTNLHSIRFIGNLAAHELEAPTATELRLAIEICEDLLNYLYELDYKASYLNKVRQASKSTQGKRATQT
jgi:hypothetical protein